MHLRFLIFINNLTLDKFLIKLSCNNYHINKVTRTVSEQQFLGRYVNFYSIIFVEFYFSKIFNKIAK